MGLFRVTCSHCHASKQHQRLFRREYPSSAPVVVGGFLLAILFQSSRKGNAGPIGVARVVGMGTRFLASVEGLRLLRRLTLILSQGRILHGVYPVFHPTGTQKESWPGFVPWRNLVPGTRQTNMVAQLEDALRLHRFP